MTEIGVSELEIKGLEISFFTRAEGELQNGPWVVHQEEVEEARSYTKPREGISNEGYLKARIPQEDLKYRPLLEKLLEFPESVSIDHYGVFCINVNIAVDEGNTTKYISQLDEVTNLTIIQEEEQLPVAILSVDAPEQIRIKKYHSHGVSFGGGRNINIAPGVSRHNLKPNSIRHQGENKSPNQVTIKSTMDLLNLKYVLSMVNKGKNFNLTVSDLVGEFPRVTPLRLVKDTPWGDYECMYGKNLTSETIDGTYDILLENIRQITGLNSTDCLFGVSNGVLG